MKNSQSVKLKKVKILSAFLGLIFSALPSAQAADAEVGRIAVANGDVRIVKATAPATEKGVVAKPNSPLHNDEVVKTGKDSSAKVLFTDQSIMDVGPSSALKVSDYALNNVEDRTASFSLMYGKLRAVVTQKVGDDGKVQVRSGDSVMGVRGTEFVVDNAAQAGGGTSLVVVSGNIQFQPPGGAAPISVGAGQVVAVAQPSSGGSPGASSGPAGAGNESGGDKKSGPAEVKVSSASADQISAVTKSTKTEDKTFAAAVTIGGGGGSNGGPNMASNVVNSLVVANTNVPPPASESGKLKSTAAEILGNATTNFLPPVSIVPGNLVHLSVSIQ